MVEYGNTKGVAKVNEKKMADAEWSATIVDRNK